MGLASKFKLSLSSLLAVSVMGLIVFALGMASQDSEKSLDIMQYPNQPLELVDIKIGPKSVKQDIKLKSKDEGSQWEKHNVKFSEKENWFRNIQVRIRNTSTRPIYGVRMSVFFLINSPSLRMAFELELRNQTARDLSKQPLQPGEEFDFAATENSFNEAINKTAKYGVDPNRLVPFLSVEEVSFAEDLMWRKGTLMQRDPNNPQRWRAVDSSPIGASQKKAGFLVVGYKKNDALLQQEPTRCQQQLADSQGTACSSGCSTWFDLGNGVAGNLSQFPLEGKCRTSAYNGADCTQDTTHQLFAGDETCSPTPTPTPTPCGQVGDLCGICCSGYHCDWSSCGTNTCTWNWGSPCGMDHQIDECYCAQGYWSDEDCHCHWAGGGSPIVVDVLGHGFSLTDAANGVNFDLDGVGTAERISWTTANSDDAFLALDRDGNGLIDKGSELFGNFTRQPSPPTGYGLNGFNALAVFDRVDEGGNADGLIDSRDAVFARLRLWQDLNHDGISQPNELHTLNELGLKVIDLNYKESRRTDRYGNQFKYRAKVRDIHNAQMGRWAWDVFLLKEN